MAHFADEAGRSLRGTWELLQRQAEGLTRFEFSVSGFWRSFGAIAVAAPAFVALLAAEQARLGVHGSLFAAGEPVWRAVVAFLAIWAAPLAALWLLGRLFDLRRRVVAFIIAVNWTGALAAGLLALPALLYAGALANEAQATAYALAAMALIAHLQWFTAQLALGVSGGVAAMFVGAEIGVGALLRGALV